jgi:hypothetical protein
MANLLRFWCPVCGLEVPFPVLDEFSAYMATWEVGHRNSLWTDVGLVCPNGHRYAVNFKVELTREA